MLDLGKMPMCPFQGLPQLVAESVCWRERLGWLGAVEAGCSMVCLRGR